MNERPATKADDGIEDADEAKLSDAEIAMKYMEQLAAAKLCSPLSAYRLMVNLARRNGLSRFHQQSLYVYQEVHAEHLRHLQEMDSHQITTTPDHIELIMTARGQSDEELARLMNSINKKNSPFGAYALKQLSDEVATRYHMLNSKKRSSIEWMLRKKSHGSYTNYELALAAVIRADYEDRPTTNPHLVAQKLARLPNAQT